jgi:hypothetical protein
VVAVQTAAAAGARNARASPGGALMVARTLKERCSRRAQPVQASGVEGEMASSLVRLKRREGTVLGPVTH